MDEPREQFVVDKNLFDQLAVELVLQTLAEGLDEFIDDCRLAGEHEAFKPAALIRDWYRPDLVFLQVRSDDLFSLWSLHWFLRSFHQQLTLEQESTMLDRPVFTVYQATQLTIEELNGMKHRIGQLITITEHVLTTWN